GSEDLKAFYGRDDAVTAQQVIAAGRVAGTIVEVAGAGKLVKSGVEYTAGKIDDAARRLAEQQQEWKFAGGEGDRSGNAGKGLPESYTRNFDGSITGPGGGRATDTGATTADGLPIYKRESGGYYTIGKNDKQEPVNSPSEHGNTLNREQTEIYIKRDADGNNEKIGISKDSATRYTQQELDGGKAVPIGNRPRVRAAEIERFMVERKPGPQNKEPWAGKRDPSHKNYDPDYVPPHMSKK
ncbi:MAG: hypothetical protein GY786_17960, partial [Proteobacteria bacterium]|nr:hypothetical protein [Pseudomonadota bacterium]